MPPRNVAGYEIVRPLSAGAQGEVFLARDRTAPRTVALKLLHASAVADADAARRFERETRAAIAIRHPNVVAALDSGTVDGRPFLVSEFVPGGSLEDLLAREKRLAPDRARRLAADLLRGLDAVHRAGLVHRDVKPANVLLSETGDGKLADLGLARRTAVERTQLTVDGAIVGTPAYVAPEQILRGDEIDGRADLYSLGVTLFECLAGERPFAADDVIALLRLHVSQAPPDLAARAGVPADLAAFVRRLLAKRPEERPVDAAAALALIAAPDAEVGIPRTLAEERGVPPPAALRFRDETGASLLAIACPEGVAVVLGRDAAGADPRRVSLRVLPHAENTEKSLRISGTHLALRHASGAWLASDRSSTHGTTLDGRRLEPGDAVEIRDGALLRLADVLDLRARLLPSAASAPATAPSLLLERPTNGSHHRYLLVAAPVALDRAARPIALGTGTTILAAGADGSLAILAAGDADPNAVPPTSPHPDDPKT